MDDIDKYEQLRSKLRGLTPEEWEQFSPSDLAKIKERLQQGPQAFKKSTTEKITGALESAGKSVDAFTESAHLGFVEPVLKGFSYLGLDPIGIDEYAERRHSEIERDYPTNEVAKKAGYAAGVLAGLASSSARAVGSGALSLGSATLSGVKALTSNSMVQMGAATGATLAALNNKDAIFSYVKNKFK